MNTIKLLLASWKRSSCAIFFLFLLLLAFIPIASGQGTGKITGTVKDSAMGTGISGAIVCADGHSNTTDSGGHYTISNLAPGPYEVWVTASGYVGASRTVTIWAGSTITLSFSLDPLSIAGRVYDASTMQGIAYANLTAGADFSVPANSSGHYLFIKLPPSSYTVTAGAPGYTSQSKSVTVIQGQTAWVNFTLSWVAPGTIKGAVTDSRTELAIQNAEISARAQGTQGYELSNKSDQNGDYILNAVPAWSDWELEVYALGYNVTTRVVSVESGSIMTENFALDPLGRLNGTVTDASTGFPIAQVLVKAEGYLNRTDAQGRYVIWNVESGTYLVSASAPGYATQEKPDIELRAAETTTVNFQLTPAAPGKIEGYVKDAITLEGIAGALVTADGHSNTTDSQGYYVLSNIPTWTYTITASMEGYVGDETKRTVSSGQTATANFQLTPRTAVFVTPVVSYADNGTSFMISVNITMARLVYKWLFYLRWDATMLDLANVEEGEFLRGPSGNRLTSFQANVYQTDGYMTAFGNSALTQPDRGVNGSGTLARLTFQVEKKGRCSLVLYFVTLYDPDNNQSFPHETRSGIYDSLPGDLNDDGFTNILDVFLLGKTYGSTPADPTWDSRADIDCNRFVDIVDLEILMKTYGRT
jgi:uncharacterized membrane protein